MGTFLHIGFVAKTKTTLPDGIPTDTLLKQVEDYYPVSIYDIVETDGTIHFSLKPEIIREELSAFVRQVYQDYHGQPDKGWLKNALDFIQEHAGNPDWLEKAKEAALYDFLPDDYACTDTLTIEGKRIRINATVVILGSEGKFLMEEWDKTLQFMETCAQRAYAGFRLGKAFRVFVY